MSFKLLIVFALVGLVAAELSEKERLLYETIGRMERALYHDKEPMEPDAAKKVVDELVNHLYKELPLPRQASSVDRWMRTISQTLYAFSEPDNGHCDVMADYNRAADMLATRYANMPNAVSLLRFYQQKQNEICKSS